MSSVPPGSPHPDYEPSPESGPETPQAAFENIPPAPANPPAYEAPRFEAPATSLLPPGYGQPAPYNPAQQAPQYGAPQYGAPQYGAPQYGAPQYGAPQYGAPPPYGEPYGAAPAYGAAPPAQPDQAAQYNPAQQYNSPQQPGQYDPTQQYNPPQQPGQYDPTQQYNPPQQPGQYDPTQQYNPPQQPGQYDPTQQYNPPQQYASAPENAAMSDAAPAQPSAPVRYDATHNAQHAQPRDSDPGPSWQPGGGAQGAYGAPPNQPYGAPARNNLPYGGVPGLVVPAGYIPGSSATRRSLGVIGLVIGLIGAAAVAVSFTGLNWLSGAPGASTTKFTFSDLHDVTKTNVGGDTPAIVSAYFSWLGWALLAGVIVFTVLGSLPTRMHPLWRTLGIVTGFGGAVLTWVALADGDSKALADIYKYSSYGFWIAMAGFVVAGIGAVVGPRRVRI